MHRHRASERSFINELAVHKLYWLTCLKAVQGIVDVEEHPGGAVSNYVAISGIVTQMQERVNAMRACHSYYISLAYTQVGKLPCKGT